MDRHRAGFEDVVDQKYDWVLNRLTAETRDRGVAEDLAQEAFLRLFRARPFRQEPALFKNPRLVSKWLLMICRSLISENGRRKSVINRAMSYSSGPGSDKAAAHEVETGDLIARVLGVLPENYRDIWILRMEGRSYREIARQFGITQGAVAMRLCRTRDILAGKLVEYGLGPR
jgi:RNA polymerase sigma factor (sigma-70 family)